MSLRTRESDLEDVFTKYGEVSKCVIIRDQKSDESRGFGFVTFRDQEDATDAVKAMNGKDIDGREVRVDYSITKKAHTPTPGKYYGRDRPFAGNPARGGDGRYDRDDRRGYSRYDRSRSRDRYSRRSRSRSRDRRRRSRSRDDRRDSYYDRRDDYRDEYRSSRSDRRDSYEYSRRDDRRDDYYDRR